MTQREQPYMCITGAESIVSPEETHGSTALLAEFLHYGSVMLEVSDCICDDIGNSAIVFFGDVRRFVIVTHDIATPSPVVAKMSNHQEYVDMAKQKYLDCKAVKKN